MSTLLNKYYTGTYDPNLASEVETARPVVKLDAPVYHQTQATKVIWEYPWPYTQMIMAQDGKVQPEQFQGRERPSDGFIKTIVRKQQEAKRKIEREERQKPLVDSQNIDKLLKQQAVMKFQTDNRNRNVQYEASLLSGEEREQYLAQNNNRDRYFGVQALENPATKRYMQFQQDLGKYFQGVNLTLDQIATNTRPGAGRAPPSGGGVGGTDEPPPPPATPPRCPPPGGSDVASGSGVAGASVGLGTAPVSGMDIPGDDAYDSEIGRINRQGDSAYESEEPDHSSGLLPAMEGRDIDADEKPEGPMGDEGDKTKLGEVAAATAHEERSGIAVDTAVAARAAASLEEDDEEGDGYPSDAPTIIDIPPNDRLKLENKEYTPGPTRASGIPTFKNHARSGFINVGGTAHRNLIDRGFGEFKWVPPLPGYSPAEASASTSTPAKKK